MIPETHTARGYVELDKVVHRLESWLSRHAQACNGYSADAVRHRIVQKITMMLVDPFLKDAVSRFIDGDKSYPSSDKRMVCAGLVIRTDTGKVRPQARTIARSLVEFMFVWSLVLGAWLRAAFQIQRPMTPATLVLGIPAGEIERAEGDGRFLAFCERGPVEPLAKATRLVIQSLRPLDSSQPAHVSYARLPLLALLASSRFSPADILYFIGAHFYSLFTYLWTTLRNPIGCLLNRDFAFHAAAALLNRQGTIEAVVITNTNWFQQYLWMWALPGRQYKLHLAVYSLNSHALMYKQDPVEAHNPAIRHLRVDHIWAWNEDYRQTIQKLGIQAHIHVVGPILWYLPESQQRPKNHGEISVVLFDVSPLKETEFLKLGRLCSYFSSATVKAFVADIVSACEMIGQKSGRKILLYIKHKRRPSAAHDDDYFDHVASLCESGKLQEIRNDSNLYSIIGASTMVIVLPYSSPAYVADFLGVPAIYYDPTGKLLFNQERASWIHFVSGRDDLALRIRRLIEETKPSEPLGCPVK